MVDLSLLLSPRFWFAVRWNPLQPSTALLMASVFGVLLLAGVLLRVVPKRRKEVDLPLRRALARGGNVLVVTGLLGVFLTVAAYEQAGILAARFWFLLLFVLFLGWSGWAIWKAHILVPAEREAASIRARFKRYFARVRRK